MGSSNCIAAAGLLAALACPALAQTLDPQPPVLVSVRWDTGGIIQGLCNSRIRLGPDSRYLSFACYGDDLTPGDTNDRRDSVLLDRDTGDIHRISISTDGEQTYFDSAGGDPSPDGRQVAFMSAGPLHPDYHPPPAFEVGRPAVYLRHVDIGQTDLISRDAFGQALTGPLVYYGANFDRSEIIINYAGDIRVGPDLGPFGLGSQLWIKNWQTEAVELISYTPDGEMAASGSFAGAMTANGRYVVFINAGAELGPPARAFDNNIYLRDRGTGAIERLTWPFAGGEFVGSPLLTVNPRVSADVRFVAFSASNSEIHPDTATIGGTHVYLLDRQDGHLHHLSATPGYASFNTQVDISDDGRYVAWFSRNFSFDGPPDPPADMRAIRVLDRDTGQLVNVTAPLGPLFQDGEPILSLARDGSSIAFTWRVADTSSPLFGRLLAYTVDLLGEPPPPPPPAPAVPVPVASLWWLLLLAAAMVLTAGTYRRSGSNPRREDVA